MRLKCSILRDCGEAMSGFRVERKKRLLEGKIITKTHPKLTETEK